VKLRPYLLLLSLLLAASLLAGCGLFVSNPPSVGAVTLTDKVDASTKAPLTSLTKFPKESKLMYVSARVENARKGTRVEARWYYDKEGNGHYGVVDTATVTFDVQGDRYVAFSLAAATTFPAGKYKVEIYLDDKLVKEQPFTAD
jgi:hypothetical protein